MPKSKTEAQERALRRLGLTEVEIAEVLEADARIDKGEKLFELQGEAKRAEKQMCRAPKAVTAYTFAKKERKTDSDKKILLDALMASVEADEITKVSNEREFEFVKDGRKYRVTLSCPRK